MLRTHRATARRLAIAASFGGLWAAAVPAHAAAMAFAPAAVPQQDARMQLSLPTRSQAPGVTPAATPTTYTFTAASSGDLVAYFMGSTAMYDETLTVLVNGVASGVEGLDNHQSSFGQQIDFGHVQAGDSLVFQLDVATTGQTFYSDLAMNGDGFQHVTARPWSGRGGVPTGTYVGFEDTAGGGDRNYRDETFVFTELGGGSGGLSGGGSAAPVPEPASAGMLLAGLVVLGAAARQRRA